MAVYNGINGVVVAANKTLVVAKSWRVSTEVDKDDITGMGGAGASRWRAYNPTLAGWSVEAQGLLDSTDGWHTGATPAVSVGQTVSFIGTVATGKTYSGVVLIDSVELEGATDGHFEYTISGTGTGAIAYPT